jgi:hypothetical protein
MTDDFDFSELRAAAQRLIDVLAGLEEIARAIPALNERRIKAGLKPVPAEEIFRLARLEAGWADSVGELDPEWLK